MSDRSFLALRIYEGASEVHELVISGRTIEQFEADRADPEARR